MHKVGIRYARSGEASIAYQVVGNGPLDLVLIPGFPCNLEVLWEDPGYRHLAKRLSGFSRLILVDPRGCGLSDRLDPARLLDIQARAEDLRAVLDAVGSGRAVLFGASDHAAQAILFAASHPRRMRALILYGGFASAHDAAADGKWTRALAEAAESAWGSGATLARLVPGRADDRALAEWWGRLERLSASPAAALAHARWYAAIDVRDALPAVATPTLVLHRTEDAHVGVKSSRQLARAIANARLVELPGRDHPVWLGDVDGIADLVEEFLTGERSRAQGDRVLAALLVARVVGAARNSAGATAGRHVQERMELFRDAAARLVARHGGQAQWSGSERIDARFGGAARALGGAVALRDAAASFGLSIAQGIHAGDVDAAAIASGQALDIADRIATSTRHAEILLSRLASELVSGSGMQFVERGSVTIDGVREPVPVVMLASERHLEPLKRSARPTHLDVLSRREREVLGLVADGLSNPHIAVQLGLSEHTVKRHVANILMKLELPSRAAAAGLLARQSA